MLPIVNRRTLLGSAVALGTTTGIAGSVLTRGSAHAAPAGPADDPAGVEAELAALDKPIYLFETTVPATVSAVGDSTLTITGVHAKVGRHSLQWDHTANAQLRVETELRVGTADPGQTDYFAVWLYRDRAVDADLQIQFGRGDRIDASQTVHLEFTGWRAVWLRYERDLLGEPRTDMDRITMIAPDSGTTWIDQLVTNVSLRSDRPLPDLQTPTIAEELPDAKNYHWMGLLPYWQRLTDPGFDTADVTEEEIADGERIRERLLTRQRAERPYTDAALTGLEQQLIDYGVPELVDPDAVGADLQPATAGSWIYDRQLEVIPVEHRAAVVEISSGQQIRTVWDKVGLPLAQTWDSAHRAGDSAAAARAGQLFVRLMVHLLDQGWAAGSGQGTTHHIGYTIRSWVQALLMTEPLLRERRLWDPCSAALEWYVGTGRLTQDFSEPRHRSGLADVLNTLLEGMLTTCFVPEDAADRVGRLRALRDWLDHSHGYTPGLDGGYKPDGSIYHHNGPYPLYGRDGLSGSIPVILDVVGAVFALGPHGQQVLTTALRHQVLLANTIDYPLSLSGRHQTGTQGIRGLVNPHALLGRTRLDGGSGLDADHAAMFRRLMPPDPSSWMTEMDTVFADAEIDPAPAPEGYWAFPYGSTGIHRQAEWQVAIRSHNRYIWSTEIYVENNVFGRYQTYGQISVLGDVDGNGWVDLTDNGIVLPGYDWNFIPGTTTRTLPFDQLQADLGSGVESMPLTESSFGGSGVLHDTALVFGMELKEHPAFDPTHTARVSALVIGDRVIALGSGIRNGDARNPTRTTLFQVCPEAMSAPHTMASGDNWVTDPAGHGYVRVAGPELVHRTASQTTPDQSGTQQGTRVVSLGYLDHGTAPDDSGYAYVLLVDGGSDRTAALAAGLTGDRPAVRIIQRDRDAHVVTDGTSQVTAHVVFEADAELADDSTVRAANRQVMVLSQPVDRLTTAFSVTDPDLHLYRGRDEEQYDGDTYVGDQSPYTRPWQYNDSIPTDTTITLRGRWRLRHPRRDNVSLRADSAGDTLVTTTGHHGASVEFQLIKVAGPRGNDESGRQGR